MSREVGFKVVEAQALRLLGQCALAAGDHDSAGTHFIDSIHLEEELDHREGIAENLEGIASLAAAQSKHNQAVQLFSSAEALRATLGIPLPPADASDLENWKTISRDELGDTVYASVKAKGAALTMDKAIKLATQLK